MKKVCFDTHLLIWAVKGQASKGQADFIVRTRALIKSLGEDGILIGVPSVVIAELLAPLPEKESMPFLNKIKQHFTIWPFDAMTGLYFAELWRKHKSTHAVGEPKICSREEMKADFMIAATALQNKALALYTHDKKLKTFAENHLDVKEVPLVTLQKSLIDDTWEQT